MFVRARLARVCVRRALVERTVSFTVAARRERCQSAGFEKDTTPYPDPSKFLKVKAPAAFPGIFGALDAKHVGLDRFPSQGDPVCRWPADD